MLDNAYFQGLFSISKILKLVENKFYNREFVVQIDKVANYIIRFIRMFVFISNNSA